MKYRPEIDGLRCVAVLAVVLFHFHFFLGQGGFIGVDVFFVISGYLISLNILHSIDTSTFSFKAFYEKRCRRIIPALFFTTGLSFWATLFVFLPDDMVSFGKSLIATSIFCANIFFWKQSGYFDSSSNAKPLLHIWSLGVEEQFYIIFPLFLFFIFFLFREKSFQIIIMALLTSFIFGLFQLQNSPSAAFFLLPARCWEILLGTVAAFITRRGTIRGLSIRRKDFFGWAGLLCIVVPCVVYSKNVPFPGMAALLPCCGTFFLLLTADAPETYIHRLLSQKIFVGIGKLSYSLYLVHWPIVVFFSYAMCRSPSAAESFFLFLIMLALAGFSYQFVETPIRRGAFSRIHQHILLVTVAAILLQSLAGYILVRTSGFSHIIDATATELSKAKYDGNHRRAECHGISPDVIAAGGLCPMGIQHRPLALLSWGDSHMDALMPMLEDATRAAQVRGLHASYSACPPLLDVYPTLPGENSQLCVSYNQAMLKIAKEERPANIVLGAQWLTYTMGWLGADIREGFPDYFLRSAREKGDSFEKRLALLRQGMEKLLSELQPSGAHVWILLPLPVLDYNIPHWLAVNKRFGIERPYTYTWESYLQTAGQVRKVLEEFESDWVHILDPAKALFPEGSLLTLEVEGKPLFRDSSHLSTQGSLWVRKEFQPLLQVMAKGTGMQH